MPRHFILPEKNNLNVTPCPRCGNKTDFTAYSERSGEDCCDIWVVCKCGYDPTAGKCGAKLEDVWGVIDNITTIGALSCWNDALEKVVAESEMTMKNTIHLKSTQQKRLTEAHYKSDAPNEEYSCNRCAKSRHNTAFTVIIY